VNELIKINNENKVDGRSLHEFLQIETPFKKWIDRMLEYGFVEGVDFWTEDKNVRRADGAIMPQTQTDYLLTIDMAKEISMIQRNERGKQARLYFIECEKRLKEQSVVRDSYMIADPVERALKWAEEEKIRQEQANQIEAQKPMVLFASSVSASKSEILVGELAKIIKQNGVDMGEKRLFAWLREHGYLISRKGNDWNMPTQYSMERGLFRIKETTVNHSDGHTTVNKTPKVTGKGQIYFVNKFLGKQKAKALPQ